MEAQDAFVGGLWRVYGFGECFVCSVYVLGLKAFNFFAFVA